MIYENQEKVNSFVAQVLRLKPTIFIFRRFHLDWVENSEKVKA